MTETSANDKKLVSYLVFVFCVFYCFFVTQAALARDNSVLPMTENLHPELKLNLHKKLDHLAAQGHGLIQDKFTPEVPNPGKNYKHVPTMSINQKRDFDAQEYEVQHQKFQQEIKEKNADSLKKFNQRVAEIKDSCGGKMYEHAIVGMSDETFRNCTKQARFNQALQIVVSKNGNIPLRLYIFSSTVESRVYTINGVITAVKD
jgi:hypothetical protein